MNKEDKTDNKEDNKQKEEKEVSNEQNPNMENPQDNKIKSSNLINYYQLNNSNQNQPEYLPEYIYNYQLQLLKRTEMYIGFNYPSLYDINQKNEKIVEKIDEYSKFFLITTLTEEDIHKSIKYGIWSSDKNCNLILDKEYKLAKSKNSNVFLFFTCIGTERYVGVCRLISDYDEKNNFNLWTQDDKWLGTFKVEWLLIKDVPFQEFENKLLTVKVSNTENLEEVSDEYGKSMMEIFVKFQNSNTLLEHFEFYDERQKNYEMIIEKKKKQQQQKKSKKNNYNYQWKKRFNYNYYYNNNYYY